MDLEKEFQALRSLMLVQGSPFLVSLLYRCKIVATSRIPTAAVDEEFRLLINPTFFEGLTLHEKIFVLFHEIIHIAFLHIFRMKGKERDRFNIAADCVANTILDYFSLIPKRCQIPLVTAESIALLVEKPESEIKQLSVEAIYKLLENLPEVKIRGTISLIPNDLLNGKKETKEESMFQERDLSSRSTEKDATIQEGDPEFYGKKLNPEEVKTYWQEAINTAILTQKTAGSVPQGLVRIFENFLKPKVNWRTLLKKEIITGLGKTRIIDWRKTSRKHPLLPGVQVLQRPTVFSLVDTSGSISQRELSQFLSENFHILKMQAKIVIIPWDAQAYDPIEIERPSQFVAKIRDKIKGCGGTLIYPALVLVSKLMKKQDIVVVFTDGEIFDLQQPETQEFLQRIGRKSAKAIFVTANIENKVPFTWIKIKIEPLET